jgi:hypothetical protein
MLIERFDSEEASNLLTRKTHLLELPITCLPGRVARYSGELLSEFHGHPPPVSEPTGRWLYDCQRTRVKLK